MEHLIEWRSSRQEVFSSLCTANPTQRSTLHCKSHPKEAEEDSGSVIFLFMKHTIRPLASLPPKPLVFQIQPNIRGVLRKANSLAKVIFKNFSFGGVGKILSLGCFFVLFCCGAEGEGSN